MFKEMGEDRLKVQTKLGVNMVVEAGAGTGKTTLLITRICLAVLARGTRIEKIVDCADKTRFYIMEECNDI